MNQINIIGNLTRDPELRTTRDGISVCSFTVAVNRRGSKAEGADFFRVSAWRDLGENCAIYLAKGRKVAVSGPVSASVYTGQDNQPHASLDVTARDVEFLTPKGDESPAQSTGSVSAHTDESTGYIDVSGDAELPF